VWRLSRRRTALAPFASLEQDAAVWRVVGGSVERMD